MSEIKPLFMLQVHALMTEAGVAFFPVGRSSIGTTYDKAYGRKGGLVTPSGRLIPNSLSSAINSISSMGNLRFLIRSAISFSLAIASAFFRSASSLANRLSSNACFSSSVMLSAAFFLRSSSSIRLRSSLSFRSCSSFSFFCSAFNFSISFFFFRSLALFCASLAWKAVVSFLIHSEFILYEFLICRNLFSFNPALMAVLIDCLNLLG